jgi:hypothetical protein
MREDTLLAVENRTLWRILGPLTGIGRRRVGTVQDLLAYLLCHNQIKDDQMGGIGSTHVGDEKFIQNFGQETCSRVY